AALVFRSSVFIAVELNRLDFFGGSRRQANRCAFSVAARNPFIRIAGDVVKVERRHFIGLPLDDGLRLEQGYFIAPMASDVVLSVKMPVPTDRAIPNVAA